ncbi:MAG: hypothetical protein Q8K34_14065 [Hydrogenophaga sp.]|jgi:hypothetical protein|uniref:hypothetical protein n=1 Tax=Hydrogenophaga sp. TaxID=1904254 RepID=UPI0027274A1F|nr:hypothetical protein [Hydrogenophaga sp.]MDO9201818.1 hypothetical protein [Hydrogenophaga sp.]MDO9479936.1 hypothetical protein [Hydrogenophaga sp.]MDP1894924.1 hypothetical protein [Hydrogenophaga sp.]MDP2096104.1 hypothetical protein [Hydrogenophaga sp.]MDP2221307.1 hypothetical protein [Hydrogenophaga sp.]
MRHLLLALLIALLPLRAWVGDAMAVSMLGHPAAGAVATAEHPPASTHAHPDCPDHAGGVPLPVTAVSDLHDSAHGMGTHPVDAPQPDHHQHSACDVCNGPALVVSLPLAPNASQAHTLLTLPAERFASVALQQGIKPPIS